LSLFNMTKCVSWALTLLIGSLTLGCDESPGTNPADSEQEPIATWTTTPVAAFGQLSVVGNRLHSAAGEVVQLKGVSSMWLNWENDGYAESLSALEWMRDNWRVSVIRAAVGIEPNGAYLDNPEKAKTQTRTIIQNAIDAGVYVIVDWHDHEAIAHRAEAEAFFEEIATEFGDTPNVLYETFNEPLDIDWGSALKPYHEAVLARIRAVDQDNVVILASPRWDQLPDVAAANPVDGENLMYTLHFYACTHQASIMRAGITALAAGQAVFVTEWGATDADGGLDGIVCAPAADSWHTWMRRNAVSWTAWKLDGCTDASCLFRAGAPVDGGWTDEHLQGHGAYVRGKLLE
jgi:endoglucanase